MARHRLLLVCTLTLAASVICEAQRVLAPCPEATSSTYFFPELALEQNARGDAFLREWYSIHLRVMREPSLSCGIDATRTIYRFTWLRSFHHPVMVRVEKSAKGSAQLFAVELSGAGGYEPGKILRTNNRTITSQQWRELQRKLVEGVFESSERKLGFDGSEWIFERALKGKYAVSVQWSPSSGPRRKAGLFLLSLTGWRFRDVY